MSLLDILTGGEDQQAQDQLKAALQAYQNVQSPTVQSLTLPQLQQYVNAGLMTPAQATAYLQQSNALASENTPQTGTAAQVAALNQLSGIANAGAAGTPVEQAQVQNVENQLNETLGGQRGAIAQEMEAKGTPASLIQAALSNQSAGQDAQIANQNALQAQSQAYQTALNALSGMGNVGNALQGQQNTQANTVAQAQNAMQQFNAQNQQQNSQFNAQNQQQANAYNTQNAQNISNQNTGNANARTQYNAKLPQTVYQDQLQKAAGEAGVGSQQANLSQEQGQQNAGIWSGLLGAGATLGGDYLMGSALGGAMGGAGGAGAGMAGATPIYATPEVPAAAVAAFSDGGIVPHSNCYHDGGLCMEEGGMVPGKAKVPGNSLRNDVVTAKLSPGEAVIPRTVVQQHLPQVLAMIAGAHPQPMQHHPADVASLLSAMRSMRGVSHAA